MVDLSTWIAGGYCTKLLADGGAEVIKVEPPGGDPLRRWSASGAAIADGADGALFRFLAASKRSLVVDGTDPGGVDTFHRCWIRPTRWSGRRARRWRRRQRRTPAQLLSGPSASGRRRSSHLFPADQFHPLPHAGRLRAIGRHCLAVARQ